MEQLNIAEHLNCYLYNNQNTPLITYEEKKGGETFVHNAIVNQMIFLLRGKAKFSYIEVNNLFEAGSFLIFPGGRKYTVTTEEDCAVVVIRLHSNINFCNHFPFEMLYELSEKSLSGNSTHPYMLKTNEMISGYLDNVVKSLSDGLKCAHFHDLKQKELLFYLRCYYSKKDLAAFFAPILNSDTLFSRVIYENYESVKSINDLAAVTNYSISGFKKRFIKVFGILPSVWIEKEKAKKVYYDINCTRKIFKEIAAEYNFSSVAHFSKFCKKVYGISPSVLRENTQKAVLFDE